MLAAILVAIAVSTPQPSESAPPKQIIEVRSQSALCTTLRQTIAPVLVGLIRNDQVIVDGTQALTKMIHNPSDGVARLQTENASLALVHNLALIDGLLADAKKFPANPQTDDERTADRVKAALQNVETSQKQKLNAIYGIMDTAELGKMMKDFPKFMEGFGSVSTAPDPDAQPAPVATPGLFAGAGLPVGPGGSPRWVASPSHKATTAELEARASDEIVRVATICAHAH